MGADPARAVNARLLTEQRSLAERTDAGFVDPTPWLCTDTTCPVVIGDRLVYFDEDHLSPPFARSLTPQLDEAVFGHASESVPSERD